MHISLINILIKQLFILLKTTSILLLKAHQSHTDFILLMKDEKYLISLIHWTRDC